MPTVFIIDGYRFFFYSNEGQEPPHVHVERGDAICKWWLDPPRLAWNRGMKSPELRRVRTIVLQRAEQLKGAWHDYFGKDQ